MTNDQKNPPNLPDGLCPHEKAKFPPPDPPPPQQSKPKLSTEKRTDLESTADTDPTTAPAETIDPEWKKLIDAFHLNRRSILSIPGVTAMDIGYKIKEGKFQDTLAIRVHVKRKLPKSAFKDREHDYIRKDGDTASKIYFNLKGTHVPTDVIEGNYKLAQSAGLPRPGMVLERPQEADQVDPRRRLDPLVGGISIGSPQTPAGTLGALVWDNTDGSVCILSNWHVLSGDPDAEAGVPCFQPGRLDQGRSSDVVAHLKRWSFDSQTDAAIAELNGSRRYCAGEILSLYQQISGDTPPYLGMVVRKFGRSSRLTWGFVDGLYFSSAIEYNNGIMQTFEDQIHIAPMTASDAPISEPGDSGAVWVTSTPNEGYKAVGLHFAGDLPHSSFGEYALANPMSLVMKNLDFSFRPGFLEIRDEDVLPPQPLPVQERGGPGVRPARFGRRLSGSGDQPADDKFGPGGQPVPGTS